MKSTIVEALPGFIIAKPYIPDDQTFVTAKESAGFGQISEVLDVGGEYLDDHGNLRTSPVEKGQVILHVYSPDEFTMKFETYRAVHFSKVIGIIKK